MFAVVVTFQITPEAWSDFLPLMRENASLSIHGEAGCHRFDVCTSEDRTGEVFLYELYSDRAAFDAHLNSSHFKNFSEKTGPMIAHKDVRTFEQVAS